MKPGLPHGAWAFLLILLGAALAALPLDRLVSNEARAALGRAVYGAETTLGVSISYARASPSILGALRLSSLSLKDSKARSILHADRLEADYQLGSAISAVLGKAGAEEILERITLRNVELDLDLEQDAGLLDRLQSSLRTGTGRTGTAGRLEISARRVRMSLKDPASGTVWTAEIRSLDVVFSERDIVVALDGTFSGSFRGAGSPVQRVTVPVNIRGSATRDFSSARFSIALAARSDAGILERQEFTLLLRDGIFEARKVRDEAPFDLYARYDSTAGALEAELRFESLYLSKIGHPTGRSEKAWAPWFRRPYSGRIHLLLPENREDPRLTAEIAGFLPPGMLGDDFTFRLAAEGGSDGIDIGLLEVRSANGGARAEGSFRPDLSSVALAVDIDYRGRGGRMPIRSTVRVVGEGQELFLFSDKTLVAGVEFEKLAVFTVRTPGSFNFRGSLNLPSHPESRERPTVTEDEGTERISWEGSLTSGNRPFFEAAVNLDPYELEPLEPLLATLMDPSEAELLSGLSLGGQVSFSSDFSRFSYSASDLRIAPSGREQADTFAVLFLSGTSSEISVSRFIASIRGLPVEGRLDAEFDASRVGFRTELTLRDIPYTLQGEYDDLRLIVTGDYGLSLVASFLEEGARGALSFRALPLPIVDGIVLASGEAAGELRSRLDWNLRIPLLALEPEGILKGRMPLVRISGSAGPGGGEFPDVRIDDGKSRYAGTARYTGAWASSGTIRGEVALEGEGGEGIRATAQYEGGSIAGKLDLADFAISNLTGGTVTGSLDGTISVSGTLEAPGIRFSLALRDGSVRGRSFSAAADGTLDREGLGIREGSGRYGIHQAQNVEALVDFKAGTLTAKGAYAGFLAGDVARFRFDMEGNLNTAADGPAEFPDFSAMGDFLSVRGTVLDFSMGKNYAETWPFSLERSGRELRFLGGENGEVQVQVLDDGSFLARAVPPFPLSAIIVGKVADRQIAMDLSDIQMEMTTLWPLIPIKDVRFLSGVATGSLTVRGNSADPEIYGSLRFQDAVLEVPEYVNAPIGPVTSQIGRASCRERV